MRMLPLDSSMPTAKRASGITEISRGFRPPVESVVQEASIRPMYQVKHARKNNVAEFDLEQYQQANDSSECRQEFHRILDEGRLTYHFQPIADAHTGKIMAYEALMRVDATTLKGPEQILNIARREGRLNDIERLTWFKSAEIFQDLLDQGQALPDALLFVNSIASQALTPRRAAEFHRRFSTLQPRIVTEILESEDMADGKLLEQGSPDDIFGHPENPRLQDFLSKVL